MKVADLTSAIRRCTDGASLQAHYAHRWLLVRYLIGTISCEAAGPEHCLQERRPGSPAAYKSLPAEHCWPISVFLCVRVCTCVRVWQAASPQLHYSHDTSYRRGCRLKPPSAIFSRLKTDRAPKSQVSGQTKAGKCSCESSRSRRQPAMGHIGGQNGSKHLAQSGQHREESGKRPVLPARVTINGILSALHRLHIGSFYSLLSTFMGFLGDERRQNALNPLHAHTQPTFKSLNLLLKVQIEGIKKCLITTPQQWITGEKSKNNWMSRTVKKKKKSWGVSEWVFKGDVGAGSQQLCLETIRISYCLRCVPFPLT